MSTFKVGGWVRNTWLGTVKQYSYSDKAYDDKYNGTANESKHWEHWQPKPGEWCWFYDDGCRFPILAKFKKAKIKKYGKDEALEYKGSQTGYYSKCEPFIGELPNFIKREIK